MNLASIDIGTNTVLLLIAEVDGKGTITPIVYEQRVPRLGKGVDASRNLNAEAMQRVVDVLQEYRSLIERHNVERTIVFGTSAVRDASNKQEFAELIHSTTGLELEILTGNDEALWTFRGAISGIPNLTKATVIDIGGGSTEITVGDEREIFSSVSLNVGSVRLTERFFKHDPPTPMELENAIAFTEDEIAKAARFDFKGSTLVGVAGTATSLAVLAQGLKSFSIGAVTNYSVGKETVSHLFRTLQVMASHEILSLSSVMEGRSDVITAGALIAREIMEHFGFESMVVSERGVRYGIVIREWEKERQ
ncbi:MAG: Ppx/GppA family phosphatase [Ignavibacteriae bacterium]|nr:Ppx/GppA family phosphatase [Ignavibacteriota bacterium]